MPIFNFLWKRPQPVPAKSRASEDDDYQEDEEQHEIDGDRGMPSVNKTKSLQSRMGSAIILLGLLGMVGLGLFKYYQGLYEQRQEEKAEKQQQAPSSAEKPKQVVMNFPGTITDTLPPPDAPPPEAGQVQAGQAPINVPEVEGNGTFYGQPPQVVEGGAQQPPMSPEQAALEKRLKGTLRGNDQAMPSGFMNVAETAEPSAAGAGSPDPAGGSKLLDGFRDGGVAKARIIPDRNLIIAKGATMDCTLEEELDSSLAGMASCNLARDVYGDNGRVILLEKGTKCTGDYDGDMKPGMARIGIVWSRCKTPRGVIVDLESPAIDNLGRAGVDGYVDNRFWDRFGAAILLTLIEQGASIAGSRSTGDSVQINNAKPTEKASDLIMEITKSTADLPAVLRKHRGERVGVHVARDLDFRDVYVLEKTEWK